MAIEDDGAGNGAANDTADGGARDESRTVLETLRRVAKNLVNLSVTTEVTGTGGANAQDPKIRTTINLVDGDIRYSVDNAFLTDEALKPLRDYHETQVRTAQEIVRANIACVSDLAVKVRQLLD